MADKRPFERSIYRDSKLAAARRENREQGPRTPANIIRRPLQLPPMVQIKDADEPR